MKKDKSKKDENGDFIYIKPYYQIWKEDETLVLKEKFIDKQYGNFTTPPKTE